MSGTAQRGAIRQEVRTLARQPTQHPGLLLDRYQPTMASDDAAFGAFLDQVTGTPAPAMYSTVFEARRRGIESDPHSATAVFRVAGSGLIVGLGGASVRETSIALLRNYGVPYIPGSALKGLARAWVRHVLTKADPAHTLADGSAAHRVLFGDQGSAGYIVWHDAWYVPSTAPGDRPLRRDVITVHHPRYYITRGRERAPWDLDDPNPVAYLTATGHYLVAVTVAAAGPAAQWARLALDVLTRALAELGAGAKTSSGYGRLLPVEAAAESPAPAGQPAVESALVRHIREIASRDIKTMIGNYVNQWRQLSDSAEKLEVGRAILDRVNEPTIERKWRESRSWYQEVVEFVERGEG